MKPSSSLLHTTLLTTLIHSSTALVGLSWNIPSAPSTGLTEITFPISMPSAPHKSGYYFAQQFGFAGAADVCSRAKTPPPPPIIHGVFSSFVNGTTTRDANCHDGADGGAGVSCAVEVPGNYAHGFALEVVNSGGETWTGTLVDTVTGARTHIGAYTLPAGSGGLKGSQVGFVEYYPWNSGSHSCGQLPATQVVFGNPVSAGMQGVWASPMNMGIVLGRWISGRR
ncbi:hypothetical protein N7470_002239 [Penicillium chermesinum]|nr:hypothetical protein N7470_002239 [Penicillium chermesinum]